MKRRFARVDDNQKAIVQAWRKAGATVTSLAAVGAGCPDAVVGFNGKTHLVEIKDGRKRPSERKLTPDEELWHAMWQGAPVHVVCDVDQALALLWK